MDLSLFLTNPRGWFVILVALVIVVLTFLTATNKAFRTNVIRNGVLLTFLMPFPLFIAGGLYADIWRYSKYGTWSSDIPYPEFFDGAGWGFVIVFIFWASWVFWVNKASSLRSKNKNIDFDL